MVLRAILLFVAVKKLTLSDPSNRYLQDEVILNEKILNFVLDVPLYAATEALLSMIVENSENGKSSSKKNRKIPSLCQLKISQLVKDCRNTHEIDLGVFSELYESKYTFHQCNCHLRN